MIFQAELFYRLNRTDFYFQRKSNNKTDNLL